MAAPLIHIFTADIKDGGLDGLKEYAQEYAAFVEATHPRLLAFHQYLNDIGSKLSVVQIHPDSDSMAFFMKEVIPEHGVKAYEFLDQGSESSEVYGALDDAIQEQIRQYGVVLSVRPHHLGGFTRLQAG